MNEQDGVMVNCYNKEYYRKGTQRVGRGSTKVSVKEILDFELMHK